MGALRRIEIDGQTIDFVQHGMKGSVGGVWYEAQIAGSVLGRIWSYRSTTPSGATKTRWLGRIGRYETPLGPEISRLAITKLLLVEMAKRNPDRPSYYRDCDKCKGTGCHSCYAGKDS